MGNIITIIAYIISGLFLVIVLLLAIPATKLIRKARQMSKEMNGTIDESNIIQKFEDVCLIINMVPDNTNRVQMVDTSLYMKNRIIALTMFVQTQQYEKYKAQFINEVRTEIKQLIPEEENIDIEEVVAEEFLENRFGKMIRPHATLVQFKSGLWRWY